MHLKKLLFFAFLLGSSQLVLAQEDAYDAYLNKKGKQEEGVEGGKTRPATAQWRQQYMQEMGASFYVFDFTQRYFFQGAPASATLMGIDYVGRFIVYEQNDNLSASVGTRSSLGLEFNSLWGSFFMLNLPILIEANLGRGSSLYNTSKVGLFAGLGPEFNLLTSSNPFLRTTQVGAVYSVGLRFQLFGNPYYLRYGRSIGNPSGTVPIATISFGNSFF